MRDIAHFDISDVQAQVPRNAPTRMVMLNE